MDNGPNDLERRFAQMWPQVLLEVPPDPSGMAGLLMNLIEECFEVEQIQNAISRNAAAFLFDLSPLGFSGMDYNVMVVSPPPADDQEARWQAEFLAEQKQATDSLGYCFHLYLSDQRPALNPHIPSSLDAVFLSRYELARIFAGPFPKMALAAAIREQIPVHRLNPFSTGIEAAGAMFHGRRTELTILVENLHKSIAISGARRIGKTSLLKRAYNILKNRLPDDRRKRVFCFNCLAWSSFWHCCYMLAHKIEPKCESRLDLGERNVWYMLERCSNYGARPLYLFFDEVDQLIDSDASRGWPFFNLLAAAKDAGFIRFVVAGYRSIPRLVYGQNGARATQSPAASTPTPDTPLLLALEPLPLSPLTRKETESLLVQPVESLGITFSHKQEVIEQVWRSTIGNPFLVQFFGQHLFKRGSDRPSACIAPADVDAVERSSGLREFLETHFLEVTLHNGLPAALERTCALLFAHSSDVHWPEQAFLDACYEHDVPMYDDPLRMIHQAVNNLTRAQVLIDAGGKYSFAFPLMRSVLRDSYPQVDSLIQRFCTGHK